MRRGNEVLEEMEKSDNFFRDLKERQCNANPYLAGFMSERILTTETERTSQKRLLQLSLVMFEIIGLGNKSDVDYIKISKESIKAAENSKISFDPEALYDINSEIASIAENMIHVKTYVRHVNNIYNEFEGTNIIFEDIWKKMEIFLRAYWIEKQKHK